MIDNISFERKRVSHIERRIEQDILGEEDDPPNISLKDFYKLLFKNVDYSFS
jgi:hypothetical protein